MANSDNIKNDASLVDVSQIKAINKVSFKQRMKAYKRKPLSLVLLILVGLAAALSAAALIFIYVLVRGVPNLTPELFSLEYNSDNVSCMPSIINTIVLTLVTLIISVPFGVGAAIYLAEYAKRGNKLVKVIRTMAETLAGIPSIVYGLFGMLFFVYALNWGYSLHLRLQLWYFPQLCVQPRRHFSQFPIHTVRAVTDSVRANSEQL